MNIIFKFKVPVLLSLIVLISNPVWFLWEVRFLIVMFLTLLLVLILVPRLKITRNQSEIMKKLPFAFLFLVFYVFTVSIVSGFQTYLFISFLILVFYPLLTEKEKVIAVRLITNSLAFIVFVSVVPWLIHTFIFKFPMFGYISYYDSKGMDSVIENYILFIQVQHDFLIRFYSIFDEPGTLGTLSAFILYANNYNFKKRSNIIILIGAILTFSLAFYILFLAGVFIKNIKNIKKILFSIALLMTTVLLLFFIFKGNDTFETTIISRFENIGSSMDDRATFYLKSYYSYFLDSPYRFTGMGRAFILENPMIFAGQTYKFFVIEFGYVGLLIILIVYLSMIKTINIYQIGCFLLFLLSFIQRPFIAQPWEILLFILIIGKLEYDVSKFKLVNYVAR